MRPEECLELVVLTVDGEIRALLGGWGYPIVYCQREPVPPEPERDRESWRTAPYRRKRCLSPTEEIPFPPDTTHIWECPSLVPYWAVVSVWLEKDSIALSSAFRPLIEIIDPNKLPTAEAIRAISSASVFLAAEGLVVAAVRRKTADNKTPPFNKMTLGLNDPTMLRLLIETKRGDFPYDEVRLIFSFNRIIDKWVWKAVGILHPTTPGALSGSEEHEITTISCSIKEDPIGEGERLIQNIAKAYWLGTL
jgi:hypothetical protein